MNSRAWSFDGIDPFVRERAEAAARRAGMSLNDWLNSTLGDVTPPDFRGANEPRPANQASQSSGDVADIHQRLDSITKQIEQISRPQRRAEAPREQGVARQLNDAISRLDARLSQITAPQGSRQVPLNAANDRQRQIEDVERAAAQVYRHSPPLSPASLDVAVAEITARQNELDGLAPRQVRSQAPSREACAAPPPAPAAQVASPPPPGPDFSMLERHLLKITSQIEALQRPDHIEQSIAAFRSELAEIRHALTEAMPRRAIESIENEIRSLHRRIDENRNSSSDVQALAGIERALGDIREVLRSLTPAEQLAGYDEAIRNLGAKLDMILHASNDPATVQQLEGAIAALRAIVSNVASNEALARLSEDVHLLASKVDEVTRASVKTDGFAVLEQRIAALTATLENRERPVASVNTDHLESALRSLTERLDRMEVGNDSASTFAHLEQRVSYLLERLERVTADHGSLNLNRVEDGLHDILRHLEKQQATYGALAESRRSAEPADSEFVDMLRRELSDIRFSQTESTRHTQDSFEAVNGTLGHVVDRLAMIEGDLRSIRSAPSSQPALPPAPAEPAPGARAATLPQAKPELANPAAGENHFTAAPRDFHAGSAAPPPLPPAPPRAISEILEPHAAPRTAAGSDLPPDFPLEPGTRPGARMASPSERIAASESAISEIPAAAREPMSSSSFIAAARRAAQAAAAAQPENGKGTGGAKAKAKKGASNEASTITSKVRSLLVGASVVVIVLGTFRMAMNLLDGGSAPQQTSMESSAQPTPRAEGPADSAPKASAPEQITPSMTSPTPLGKQFLNHSAPSAEGSVSLEIPPLGAPAATYGSGDITGTIPTTLPAAARRLAVVQVPPSERLPDAIGGPVLRGAAMKGDASAAYEVAVRFAEGKGVPANYDEAAKWYDRAAQAGVVPAIFRLGTLYEKGLGVKKDPDIARRYYMQAAERGNAKAMHNLAVLDADGGGKGANYKSAAQWFRKAADRGVADSQFNLGILYARGIGVDQNLAESFKWFTLAAAQGDADAAAKRDDVAKRLDPQSLAAARLAIQTFAAEPQPDDAATVATPAGGWDSAPAQASSTKPAAKPVASKRTATAAH